MPSPLQPEFFALLGIDLFLAVSLLTCLLDRHFPWHLPYLYQVAALAGFGQLIVSKEFMLSFGEYMRFWYSLLYLVVALANIVAVNAYLGIVKKLLNYAKVFMFTVTLPSIVLATFFVTNYADIAVHPLVMLPHMTWETTFIAIVAFDTLVVGLGTYIFFKPKWWYIALGAGTAITGASVYAVLKPSWGEAAFVTSAVALAIACILVLGVSVYVLARIWIDTLKERKRRKGGETTK
ncbi:MAG: hypothetical protein QXN36_05440 [Candidatus Bathyarchaeia archaeon]